MPLALSLFYAFLMLLLPLAEAIYNQRSPGALLYLYWVESFALLILHPLRIWLHQRWTGATGHHYPSALQESPSKSHRKPRAVKASTSPFTFLKSFVVPAAIFTAAHGLFVLLLVFVFKVTGAVNMNDVRAATAWGAGVPLAAFIVDLFALKRWPFTRLRDTVGTLGLRILVTQFGLIFGMLATAVTKSPWGVVFVFFLFRVLTDGLVDWSKRTKGKFGLPNWFARMIAKKESKTIEQVRAEFETAMKSDQVSDDTLNAPFKDARPVGKRDARYST
jgi:Family of unknown function (DUF6498)